MNKKKLLIIVACVGMLLVIAVAILLNSRDNTPQPVPGDSSSSYGETKVDIYTLDTLSTDPTETGTVPTISVITGVGDRPDVGDKDDKGNTSQGTSQSGNSTPTQGNSSSQGNNTKPDNSGSSSTDNSGNSSTGNSNSSSDNGSSSDWRLSWEEFLALSGPEQDAYFDRFDSLKDYKEWLNAAKQEYEDDHTTVIATGPITLPQD